MGARSGNGRVVRSRSARGGVFPACLLAVVTVVAALAGCSTVADPGDPAAAPPAASPSRQPALDPASLMLTAETYRSRFDAASGGIQLSVTNEGDLPLVVTETAVSSPALAAVASTNREVEIPAGLTRDIPLTLPAPACDDDPALESVAATLTVHAETEGDAADAATASVTIEAVDRLGQFAEWWRESCFAEAVAERATLAIRLVGDGASGTAPADTVALELVATPRSASDSANDAPSTLRLTAIGGTILLGMRDAAGAPVTSRPLEVVLDTAGTEPSAVRLETVPARCDPHAIAEDKQGTLFRVHATLTPPDGGAGGTATGDASTRGAAPRDTTSGTVTVAADDETREAIYDAITRVCAARVGTG